VISGPAENAPPRSGLTISPGPWWRRLKTYVDVNAVVGGYLRDLAFAQSSQQKMFGYKRAANAILSLDQPLTDLRGPRRCAGREFQASGRGRRASSSARFSRAADRRPLNGAIEQSERRADIQRRRDLRRHFLSPRGGAANPGGSRLRGPPPSNSTCGDLQMHSEWSDGSPTVEEIADACP